MLTPQYLARTILAGAQDQAIQRYGRFISILSISASTITLAIDDEPPQQIVNGLQIDCENRRYKQIRLANVGGAPSTVILMLSETPLRDLRGDALTGAMAASLANIEQEINGSDAPTQVADLLLPITPGPGLQIFAANAARTEVEVTSPRKNAGTIYLGITAARATLVDNFYTLSPGGIWYSDRAKHAVFACGSDALQFANGKEI
jgi:hypothetical protein